MYRVLGFWSISKTNGRKSKNIKFVADSCVLMKLLFLIGRIIWGPRAAGPETNKVVLNEAAFLFLLGSLRKKSQSIIDVYYALLISVIIYSTFTVELIKNYANY